MVRFVIMRKHFLLVSSLLSLATIGLPGQDLRATNSPQDDPDEFELVRAQPLHPKPAATSLRMRAASKTVPNPEVPALPVAPDSVIQIAPNSSHSASQIPKPASVNLSAGESLAACYKLLCLAPPFEEAAVSFSDSILLAIADPSVYFGPMAPISGNAIWIQGNGKTYTEQVTSNSGFRVIRWPSKQLGPPEGSTVALQFHSPVIVARWFWSDYALYGVNMRTFFTQQVANWEHSPRRVFLQRSGYREDLFPTDLTSGLRHPQVGPLLEPQIRKVAPEFLLKTAGK
jgi:hypothetical protein